MSDLKDLALGSGRSKTILTAVAFMVFASTLLADPALQELAHSILGDRWPGILLFLQAITQFILRYLTTGPLSEKSSS